MKVSIITVCFNSVTTIRQTIESVINQSYTDVEYIVIDGGSTDNTMGIVENFRKDIDHYVSEKDDGIYDAMNKGILASTGEIIGIVNSDDWLETDAVSKVVKTFEETDADIVHGKIREIGGRYDGRIIGSSIEHKNVWTAMPVCHPATFVKRSVYEKIGLYSLGYKLISDYEFICRCYLQRMKFVFLDEVLSNFRSTGMSSQNTLTCVKEELSMVERYKDSIKDYSDIYQYHIEKIKRVRFRELIQKGEDIPISSLLALLDVDEQVILWGIGRWGTQILDYLLDKGVNPSYIIDRGFQNDTYKGIPVVRPETVHNEKTPILISIIDFDKECIPSDLRNTKLITLEEWVDSVIKD